MSVIWFDEFVAQRKSAVTEFRVGIKGIDEGRQNSGAIS